MGEVAAQPVTDRLLVIDVGNTQTVFALFDNDALSGQWRLSTQAHRSADEYGIWLTQLLAPIGLHPADIGHVMLATVVPDVQFEMMRMCLRYCGVTPLILGAIPLSMNITVDVDAPDEVGGDRLVNALEGWKRYQCGLLVLDFGTATTFDVVSQSGSYVGGVIAPGVNLSLEALQHAAAKLPSIRIRKPRQVVGRNTVSAMESGAYYGYVSLIEGLIARIMAERGDIHKVIATGGLASLYARDIDAIDETIADLTIHGLHTLYSLNKDKLEL